MRILQLTPGAGGMYCGNCFRDNALVAEWRRQGHEVLMVPLYLPLTLDEANESAGTPIFFSGINVYLEQHWPGHQHSPAWLRRALASPTLLKLAGRKAGSTSASELGDLTSSMLQGENGRQARELEELIQWLKGASGFIPEVISLSNVLLLGMARRLREAFGVPVVCSLQGEDHFLDSLPEPGRTGCWDLLRVRAGEVSLFVSPSQYFADLMRERMRLAPERVSVVYNGLGEWPVHERQPIANSQPVIGFFARMCREKGLDRLVEAFLLLRQTPKAPNARLMIGGSCGPSDEPLVSDLKARIHAAGLEKEVEFHPNVTREEKIAFLQSLDVFSVPAEYGEAFGLYIIEALAAGVPVVQPAMASFPELVQLSGSGLLYTPGDTRNLADRLLELLGNPELRRQMSERGRAAVKQHFNLEQNARKLAELFRGCRR